MRRKPPFLQIRRVQMEFSKDVREYLADHNPDFKRLMDRHQDLGQKIDGIDAKKFLSPEEETELHAMKKEKLFLKDQMFQIAQEHKDDLAKIGH